MVFQCGICLVNFKENLELKLENDLWFIICLRINSNSLLVVIVCSCLYLVSICTVSQKKTRHQSLAHNFTKY